MTITENITGGASYRSIKVQVLGNTWEIMEVKGKYNYIGIYKVSNNPFGTIGKQFNTWDEACRSYKSPAMKTALLMAEIEFLSN